MAMKTFSGDFRDCSNMQQSVASCNTANISDELKETQEKNTDSMQSADETVSGEVSGCKDTQQRLQALMLEKNILEEQLIIAKTDFARCYEQLSAEVERKNGFAEQLIIAQTDYARCYEQLAAGIEQKNRLTDQVLAAKADYAKCYERLAAEVEQRKKLLSELQFNIKNMQDFHYRNGHLKTENNTLRERVLFVEKYCSELEDELRSVQSSKEYKSMQTVCRFTESVHSLFRRIQYFATCRLPLCLPLSFQAKERRRIKSYTKYAELLKDSKDFQEYERIQKLIDRISPDAKTGSGLVIPDDVPMTSIIIPVYNNYRLTVKCLMSIFNSRPQVPFEVVVADDCSQENVGALAKSFPGVRIVRNQENLGFLRTANRAAEEAKGEYLLFLNNDTIVLPGWLDELAVALYQHPDAGMIGSQLIHLKTGKLQESGNVICKNGDIIPLGRGEDPMDPEYTYFREVDFCSGASIIVSRTRFEAAGGFDTVYAPAYYEDPDLALKFKKKGWKNYVMPLSKVLHVEMASYGNTFDTSASCGKNYQTFIKTWRKYLNENAIYDSGIQVKKEHVFSKPRVLFIDAEVPMADRGSGGMDSVFFMNYLIKRGYDVVFHGEYTAGYVSKYTSILLRMGVRCVYAPQQQIWDFIRNEGKTLQYVFICRIYQAQCFDRLIRTYAPQAVYIFDTVDVHFVRERREAELEKSDGKRLRSFMTEKLETTVMSRADSVIVISSDEKKMLESQYGIRRIAHIPQAREVYGCAKSFKERDGIVFIGSAHPPNLDGLKYYVEEILPVLKKKGMNLTLTVIGEALRNDLFSKEEYSCVAHCPGIRFAGFVADLGDYLNNAKITIAPLRYGAGTKGKVASSMAYGVPCVSSSFGTEGTGMVNGENILVASDAESFADAVIRLVSDEKLWQKISDNGLLFLKNNYAPEIVEKQMDSLMMESTGYKKQMNERLPQIKTGSEMITFANALPCTGGVTPEELVFSVFQNCGIPSKAAITAENISLQVRKKFIEEFPHCFFTDSLLVMPGKYDFVLLPHLAEEPYKIENRLACAYNLLYDGGRVFFTVPRKYDLSCLFERLTGMLKYQQIFAASVLNGCSSDIFCLCAVKAVPKEDDDPE